MHYIYLHKTPAVVARVNVDQYQTHTSTYKTTCTDACKTHYAMPVYRRLPEDEILGSGHLKDKKN
jgi:hypothetical protein